MFKLFPQFKSYSTSIYQSIYKDQSINKINFPEDVGNVEGII